MAMAAVDIHEFATAASQAAEARRKADEKAAVWGFLWTLFAFKILTVVAIFWAAGGSSEAGVLLSATTWPWLILPGIAIAGPLAYRYRLRRVRARREALRHAEWMVE
jgi:hypothetical protein